MKTSPSILIVSAGLLILGAAAGSAYTVPGDTNNYKWYQPPAGGGGPTNVFTGWNQPCMTNLMPIAADDWVCATTNPVTRIVWWGSYLNWAGTNPPALPQGFLIRFWHDVPKGMDPNFPNCSHPGGLARAPIYVSFPNYSWSYYGQDHDPRSPTPLYEACFRYEAVLPQKSWFYQTSEPTLTNTYWISIEADMVQAGYAWGWKTRPRAATSPAPDAAVVFDPNVPWYAALLFPDTNEWDLAFELESDFITVNSKYEQLPDLDWTGMDINAMSNNPSALYLLADDFLCTTPGPITNITIWGSWRNDYPPELSPSNIVFTLSIHTNVPPGSIPWSMPGQMRWKRAFYPGQFTCAIERSPIDEWWMDPLQGAFFPGDHVCYRYDFPIPSGWFNQQGTPALPAIYWLDVQAQFPPGNYGEPFGWKTSTNHWMDAATWVPAAESYNGNGWQMLTYPGGSQPHPWQGQKIDLAFRINGASASETIPKWSQPPVPEISTNAFNGWNQYSVYGGSNIVADDWVCTNTAPVTDIHWWGSFIGWTGRELPPVMPDLFVISFWDDVAPNAAVPFSHPGICLTNIYAPAQDPTFAGWDYDPRDPQAQPDACFQYTLDLPPSQWFWQKPGTNIYWLSIAAQYPAGQAVEFPWGWKTRPRDPASLAPDAAVRIFAPTAPLPGITYYEGTNLWWPTPDKSWDMAFSLTTRDLSNCVRLVCSTNLTVNCAPGSGVTVTFVSYVTNLCTGQSWPAVCTPASGSLFPVGNTQVWCTNVTAGVTNYCSFLVTVLTDTAPPLIHCPTNMVAYTDPGSCSKSNVTFMVTASDDCDPAPVVTCNPTNGSTFPKGDTVVNCTATDVAGNSTNCSFIVSIKDKEAPVAYCPPSIITNTDPGQCASTNVVFLAMATDNCPGVTVQCLPPSGSSFAKGVTTVICTAVDASGNTGLCTFTVTVLDQEPPSISCSTNLVVDSPNCAPVVVHYPAAAAADNCAVTNVTCVLPSGSAFPVGTNIVQCTATDSSGNTNTCSFTITVTCRSKWVQLPDLSPAGYDVRALRPKILANDFPCTKSGLITNVHLWASWLNDYADPNAIFQLGFWSDVPRSAAPRGEWIASGTFEVAFTNAGLSGPLDTIVDFIPPSWTRVETFSGGGTENSAINPTVGNGPGAPGTQASAFRRNEIGDHRSGDWTAIAQNVSLNATQYSSLTLSLDVRVWSHTLVAGGTVTPAFEWPAMVEVDYVDTNGVGQVWRYGWYLSQPGDGPRVNDPGQGLIPIYNDQVVPLGVWVANTFNLLNELPQVRTITRILVGGTGWNFESDVDNVSLRGAVTNDFSHPGELLKLYLFQPPQYSWAFYPTNRQPFLDPNYGEVIGSETNVWEYDFPFHTNEAFFQTNGQIYWLSISSQSQDYFGWKTAATNWNDDAVYGHVDGAWLPLGDWQELFAPQSARSLDLAFSLITLPVLKAPVITNVVVTNQVTLLANNQVVGLAWTAEPNLSYQMYRTTSLGLAGDGSDIVWTPCGPEILGPTCWYWETNAVVSQRFYRVLAIDP